jgi:hypothetical protein
LIGGYESEIDHKLIISSYRLAEKLKEVIEDEALMTVNVKVMALWDVALYS